MLATKTIPMRRSYEAGARICFAIGMVASIPMFGRVVGFASPWFALLASFCVLGLFDMTLPFVRTRMPQFLREVRSWEVRGGVYRAIGVPTFGTLLRRTPLRLLNRRVYLKASISDLPAVRTHIENAESVHFWGGIATIPYILIAWSLDWRGALTSIVLFHILVNVYPILHLRTVRARIDNATSNIRSRHLDRKMANQPVQRSGASTRADQGRWARQARK